MTDQPWIMQRQMIHHRKDLNIYLTQSRVLGTPKIPNKEKFWYALLVYLNFPWIEHHSRASSAGFRHETWAARFKHQLMLEIMKIRLARDTTLTLAEMPHLTTHATSWNGNLILTNTAGKGSGLIYYELSRVWLISNTKSREYKEDS